MSVSHLDEWISEFPNMRWFILSPPWNRLFAKTPLPHENREDDDATWQSLIAELELSIGSEPGIWPTNNQENPSS